MFYLTNRLLVTRWSVYSFRGRLESAVQRVKSRWSTFIWMMYWVILT